MSKIDHPTPLLEKPAIAVAIRDTWIEQVLPPEGCVFFDYSSGGPQYFIFIHHADDGSVSMFHKYVYEGVGESDLDKFLESALKPHGFTQYEIEKLMQCRYVHGSGTASLHMSRAEFDKKSIAKLEQLLEKQKQEQKIARKSLKKIEGKLEWTKRTLAGLKQK